ncbi:hypothetical protein HGRIS_005057 [Hohenbuehelia grisea]|uniref:Major facilitator superfamily (MFS) profile domain-containing protein n=1 Tax=Hohenbuehelia grisea TaxID=104357 RepID=A0ABR3JDV3_9AGAR
MIPRSARTAASRIDDRDEDSVRVQPVTPLPKLQLSVILLMQAAEQIGGSVIYPFVNQFVRETGITGGDEAKTGYYAGIIGSVLFIAECVSVLFWCRASDRVGRRPVMLLAMLGLCLSILGTGLSTHYVPLLLCQATLGLFNGSVGASKNIMAEMSDSTNIAAALAFVPFTVATGVSLGSFVGGALAMPSKRWPGTFGKLAFFVSHPYFLPCAVAGLYSATCLFLGAVFLKETLPVLVKQKKRIPQASAGAHPWSNLLKFRRDNVAYSTVPAATRAQDSVPELEIGETTSSDTDGPAPASPPLKDVLIPRVVLSFVLQIFIGFTYQSWLVLLPLMYSTSIPLGGLGLEPSQIGTVLSVSGFAAGMFQLAFFGWSVRRFGPRTVLCAGLACFFIGFSVFPVASAYAQPAGRVDGKVVFLVGVQICAFLVSKMSWGSNLIFVISSAPTPESLATVNGLAQLLHSMARGIAPAVTASLFSLSIKYQLAGGLLVYWFLLTFILCGILVGSRLPKGLQGAEK